MTACLETKKSNCKNCYKCIRHCPVKSIRFADGQAHIMHDDCVLCGECYVVCPQNAKGVRNDVDKVKALISSGNDVYISLAPSYAAWYENAGIASVEKTAAQLGFCGVSETAAGAAVVKTQYEKIMAQNKNKVVISSCCHTVNTLIERHFENAIPNLAAVISPMQAHAQMLKKEHEGCKVVFVGPCISKKAEGEKYTGYVDAVLTFEELDNWLFDERIVIEPSSEADLRRRTNAFPTSGGILKSMDLDPDIEYVAVDGMDNCIATLESIDSGKLTNCFIEMSACSGSCIGGPVMRRKKRNPAMDMVAINKVYGKTEYEFDMPEASDVEKRFVPDGSAKVMPGSAAIEEILRRMGKNTPEQELNCGSCGYNTCREKAVAVLMGKADLSMCMPYLKEKAESFSDKIIKNTPNGIIVLDEELNIQMLNSSAKKILNLPGSTDLNSSPVVRILDPVDYLMAVAEEKNTYDNRKYLAEYHKYVEETIIYDKEYHIVLIIMKDVSNEEKLRSTKEEKDRAAIEITDKVVEKQMRIVQEIASLLGETTAETKIALTKLKETLTDE